jgi:copper chaperone CopZ
MFKALFLTSAALVATAMVTAPVKASETVSPGHAQLAAQAQVDAEDYTTAEIIAILDARSEGDTAGAEFVLSHANRAEPKPAEAVTASEKQIAASLGVDAADYTHAELAAMSSARMADDDAIEAHVVSHANRAEPNPAEVVTAGEKQIAASLGVDPADYTLAELAKMLPTNDD